ncbi:MAG: InlB B-repeat-containing protein, partial [Anaeroplasma sp.]|uniref:InlB B-repeat-containing protein n=1 Tax=Anaeroplasma sp. TaxID=1872523 RepID=UPI002A9191DD
MKNKKKLWIIILIILVALLLIGGGTTAIIVSNSQINDGGKKEWTMDENQTFTYSGEEIAPKVLNLDENDKAKVVYSYSEKKDDNPLDDTYTTGLPKNAGTYYVKVALENDYKITTITIEPAEVKLEDIRVLYNQPLVSGNYFTSEMNIDQMEFEYEFTSSGNIVLGDVSLTSTFLSPSIQSYDYTFIPNDMNYKSYNGTIDIEVYAIVCIYDGDKEKDYLEVPFNSSFDYELTQKLGYEMPYFVDDNKNKFELGTKITGDLELHYIENPIDYSITYHLDGGVNGENPVSYNITDEPIYLNDASKEGYLFKGWFEDPNFNYDSLVTTIDPSQTLKSYQLYASFEWIKINPIVEFEPLALVYNGESQELVMANVEGGTITYSLDGVNYSANVPTGTNAGTYKVYYKIKGDSQHLNKEGNIEVTISKTVYDMSKISLVDKTVTYNGNEQGIEINGVLPSGVTVAYSGLGTNVGTYTIVATFTGDALNYEAIPNMSATLTIQKANLEYTLPIGKNLVFNDANQELVIPGSTSLGTILYSLDDENYSKEIPAGKNVGNYVVYYKYDINNENYNDIPSGYVQSFISKGEVVYTLPTPKELTYNGLAQELIRAGSINVGSIEYSLDGNIYSENIPTATNAGNYTVYYRFVYDKTNYNQVEGGNFTTIIAKANPTLVAPQAKELTYTGSPLALIHAGSVNAGTLVYSLDGENYKEELPQATNAGSYTVYYKVNGNDNYNDIVFETLEVT